LDENVLSSVVYHVQGLVFFGSEALASPYALPDSTAEAVIPEDYCFFNRFDFIGTTAS